MNTFFWINAIFQGLCMVGTIAILVMPMSTFRKLKKWLKLK